MSVASPVAEPEAATPEPRTRLWFVDNLRIGLIVLVVLHHVALAYGAAGPFYYYELHPDGYSRALLVFVLANQAWFMGAFFLVAGYFTPGSLARKGAVPFLRDRVTRLGIPLVVYAVLLNPLTFFSAFFLPDFLNPLSWDTYRYGDYVRMGPMWFVALLLIFSVAYVAWRALRPARPPSEAPGRSAPGYLLIGGFIVTLAAVSYLLRMEIPIGQSEWGFPSLAYFPQYLGLFLVGTVAYRRNWLRTIPASMGAAGLAAAAGAAVFLFPLAFSGRMFSLEVSAELVRGMGEGYWQSAVYALWDSTMVVGLSLGLIVLFRSLLNRRGRLSQLLAVHSYTVYIIHIPIVVFLAVALKGIEIEHLVKFGLAGAIAVPLCFAAAFFVRKLPFASRIL